MVAVSKFGLEEREWMAPLVNSGLLAMGLVYGGLFAKGGTCLLVIPILGRVKFWRDFWRGDKMLEAIDKDFFSISVDGDVIVKNVLVCDEYNLHWHLRFPF